VVDDEETVRTVISENLRAVAFVQIDTAADGEEGLLKIRNQPVDVVFLDLAMPGVPGEEVAHLALGMKPDIVIIVITGFATLEKAINLMREGVYDLIRKPFTHEELRDKVLAALEKFSRRQKEKSGEQKYLGPYEILEEIASGGGGIVYKGRHAENGKLAAIKILLSGPIASEEKVLRFHREAQAMQRLGHPHIVSIQTVGAHNDQHFIAMDFIDGTSLEELIEGCELHFRQAVTIAAGVARAIQYAHEHHILHRDLKPSNVIVDREGNPRIIDFGLAKSIRDGIRITKSKKIYGTLGYIAPERFSPGAVEESPLMDVFSLGVLLYEMLTSKVPYRIASAGEFIPNFACAPSSPSDLDKRIPEDLSKAILEAIDCDPEGRTRSALLFAQALEASLEGHTKDFALSYRGI
jgi:serine/threonine protein kinase